MVVLTLPNQANFSRCGVRVVSIPRDTFQLEVANGNPYGRTYGTIDIIDMQVSLLMGTSGLTYVR